MGQDRAKVDDLVFYVGKHMFQVSFFRGSLIVGVRILESPERNYRSVLVWGVRGTEILERNYRSVIQSAKSSAQLLERNYRFWDTVDHVDHVDQMEHRN